MIQISHFYFQTGNFQLKNIELDIYDHEIFAILGKTGSGKTMLLESVAGFYKGRSGAVFVQEKDVTTIKPEKREIGFVYQDFGLFPHLTVAQNIGYGLKMHKIPKKVRENQIHDMAVLLGIEAILCQYPGNLSGGERQRTALARALVLNPKILLMDEPFSALDPRTRNQMYDLMDKVHKTFQCTIIFVTHNFYEAQRMAQRIGIMIDGELKMICTSKDLYKNCEDVEILEFLGKQEEIENER